MTKLATNSQQNSIEFRGVSFRVNGTPGREIVSRVNLTVPHGETIILLGRSGSGKTTLLKLINGMLFPTEGEILVQQRSTRQWDLIRLRRTIGYVIQEAGLFPHFTVAENVGLVPTLENWPRERIDARVNELLQLVGMEPKEFAQRRPHELSGGQRQRVGVARALAADPPILLMDEPFGALDPVTRTELQREFRSLARRLEKTIVFVTHDLREALFLASEIVLLQSGRVVASAPPGDFLQLAASRSSLLRCFLSVKPGRTRMTAWRFFIEHREEILSATLDHVWLVLIAMLIAIAISVPLGMFIVYHKALRTLALGIASILQTIPSLALFGFLIPIPFIGGIGKRTAIVALVLYALLPILRNTYVGLTSIDPAILESAEAMGMTRGQIMFRVRFPLALSVILAGIRTATVLTIGVATIAAAIGAGGLGSFIFRGVALVNDALLLAGAIPAALLAILADFLLGLIERRLRVT